MKKNPETAIHEADAREKQAFRYHRLILKGVWCFAVLFFIWLLSAHEQWPDAGPDAPVAENHL